MDPVQVAEQRIRDIVNSPRRSELLREDRDRWLQLCSAMDAVGDTQLAVRAFLDETIGDSGSKGSSYLVVYGLLQVLYVQQDAAQTLADCLGLELELPDELQAIRDIRNTAVGHPARRHDGSSAAISRITLTPNGFQMLVHDKGGSQFRSVSVRGSAEQQVTVMSALLNRVGDELVSGELEHRRRFRLHPFGNTVPSTLGYMVEKVAEGLRNSAAIPLALAGAGSIRDALANLRGAIEERGLTKAYEDSIGRTTAEIEFTLDRIEARLNGNRPEWTDSDDSVYWSFLQAKVKELQDLADEIDQVYASDDIEAG